MWMWLVEICVNVIGWGMYVFSWIEWCKYQCKSGMVIFKHFKCVPHLVTEDTHSKVKDIWMWQAYTAGQQRIIFATLSSVKFQMTKKWRDIITSICTWWDIQKEEMGGVNVMWWNEWCKMTKSITWTYGENKFQWLKRLEEEAGAG